MILTDDEQRMLDGDYGPGIQKCMNLLVKWGQLFDAEKMVRADGVHIGCEFPTEAMEEMSEGAKRTKTFSTTATIADPKYWRERFGVVVEEMAGGYGITDEEKFEKQMTLIKKLGFLSTFTCSPYTVGVLPRPGTVLCLTGSSYQVFSNSLFGARAGRESLSTCVAAAITGKTPLMGLLKKENRYANLLVKIGNDLDPSSFTEADYGALGYYVGEVAGLMNVAIEGISPDITLEHSKMLLSPLPVSGACAMCHIIGVTPEASSLEEACPSKKYEILEVGRTGIRQAYEKLNDAANAELDLVSIGCPHLTIKEIGDLASIIEGKKVSQNVRLLLGAAHPVCTLAKECGYLDPIEKAGGMFVNSCVSGMCPFIFLRDGVKVAATNSARAAHYIQRLTKGKVKTFYGDMGKCIDAAINGRWEG